MQPHLQSLLQLQAADLHLLDLHERLAVFPKHLAEVERGLTQARQQVAAAKEALLTSLKDRKTYEMDVEQWKERAKKYRSQSAEVKTNEAYRALQHEIQNAETEMARAEDRLLERMVAGEEYEIQIKSAEAALKEIEAAAGAQRRVIQAQHHAAQKELAAAEAARAEAVAAVPEDLVDHYQRIAKRHKGVALAEVRGEGCGQCGVHIRPHMLQQLQHPDNEEIFHCETCTRMLYYAASSSAAASNPPSAAEQSTAPAPKD